MPACEDIDDIEDLIAPGDLLPSDRYFNKKDVIVRGRSKKSSNGIENNHHEASESVSQFYFICHDNTSIAFHFR